MPPRNVLAFLCSKTQYEANNLIELLNIICFIDRLGAVADILHERIFSSFRVQTGQRRGGQYPPPPPPFFYTTDTDCCNDNN